MAISAEAHRYRTPITLTLLAAWFLLWTRGSIHAGLTNDDLMNGFQHALRIPLREAFTDNFVFNSGFGFRPMGAVFYRPIYAAFGIERPEIYHVALLAILIANLVVGFLLIRRLTRSDWAPVYATLLMWPLPAFADLYFACGTVYDSLCYLFVFSAMLLYVRGREHGGRHDLWTGAGCGLLYWCALNSKEMAIALPVFLLSYELLYYRRKASFRFLSWAVPLSAFYLYVKLLGPAALQKHSGYALKVTLEQFTQAWRHYLWWILEQRIRLPIAAAMGLLAGLLVLALLSRRRDAILGWLIFFLGAMPIIFAPTRNGYVFHVAMLGLSLLLASLLEQASQKVRIPSVVPPGCY